MRNEASCRSTTICEAFATWITHQRLRYNNSALICLHFYSGLVARMHHKTSHRSTTTPEAYDINEAPMPPVNNYSILLCLHFYSTSLLALPPECTTTPDINLHNTAEGHQILCDHKTQHNKRYSNDPSTSELFALIEWDRGLISLRGGHDIDLLSSVVVYPHLLSQQRNKIARL